METTYDIKRIQKIIKKYGTIKVSWGQHVGGEIKIKRVKILSIGGWDECEVDIEYTGTISQFGYIMGPTRQIHLPGNTSSYTRTWGSNLRRNRHVRRELRSYIVGRLKYFGLDVSVYNLIIKKITWDKGIL